MANKKEFKTIKKTRGMLRKETNLLLDVRHLAVVHAGDAFQVVIIKIFGFPEGERETVLNARITT